MQANFNLNPVIKVTAVDGTPPSCWVGWDEIFRQLDAATEIRNGRRVISIECYTGVMEEEIAAAARAYFTDVTIFRSHEAFLSEAEIDAMIAPYNGGDDPIFGFLSELCIEDFFDDEGLASLRHKLAEATGTLLVLGTGASRIDPGHTLVYADLARWEAQQRMRRDEIANLGTRNHQLKWSLQYKRAYFTDWRVCDRLKRSLAGECDYVLDTCVAGEPKMITAETEQRAYRQAVTQPFRVVPFFDPAPWGGQWMRRTCGLPDGPPNYGWCFDCVPEENSVVFDIGGHPVELPSINLVFREPIQLLGEAVFDRFGAEFPIRFDFLDTIEGGNLSFQVHPLTEYIRENFGMAYTQDESYYILDAEEGATVFLGLKEGIEPAEMLADLKAAERGEKAFDHEKFACQWPARKHDHFLIPAGTCHCSGAGTMVLEISATPYIFTFKLWDWGRVGLDGLPRPINLKRGEENILWDRTEKMVEKELINAIEPLASGEDWREERTGLHATEFIETRRHWFSGKVDHDTAGKVNVLNLIEGREAIVESPSGAFAPFVVHYAETFIVPAGVGQYTIRPFGESEGRQCATIKAMVRD